MDTWEWSWDSIVVTDGGWWLLLILLVAVAVSVAVGYALGRNAERRRIGYRNDGGLLPPP